MMEVTTKIVIERKRLSLILLFLDLDLFVLQQIKTYLLHACAISGINAVYATNCGFVQYYEHTCRVNIYS